MLPSVIASAIAARDLGYYGTAQLILDQQLTAPAIARLFAMSASPDAGQVGAVILLAGSTARFNSCREGFNGDVERELAEQALGGDVATAFAKVSQEAAAIVGKHWREIAAA